MKYFIIAIVILCVYITLNIRKKKLSQKNFKASFLFTKNNPEYKIDEFKIGDVVSLWNKPNSNTINVYAQGSVGGNGYIGRFNSQFLVKEYFAKGLRLKARIEDIINDRIILDDKLIIINDEELEERAFQNKMELLRKKYKPMSTLQVSFALPSNLNWKTSVYLNHNINNELFDKIALTKDLDLLKESFWLEDENGNKISISNFTNNQEIIRVIRALNSGYKFNLEYISGSKNKYSVQIVNDSFNTYSWNLVKMIDHNIV